MRLGDLFEVQYGHSLELNRLIRTEPENGIAFVSRKGRDNGIAAFVRPLPEVPPAPAGELTCALSGNGVLSTFIQDRPYYTAFHVARLAPLQSLSRNALLYYAVCIKANRFRFSYGRQANRTLKDLLLPDPSSLPAWVEAANPFMFDGKDTPAVNSARPDLHGRQWAAIAIGSLFDLHKGKRLTKMNRVPGELPFIGALDKNNGLVQRIAGVAAHPAGVMTVNYNGNGVAEAFYQPEPFMCSDDVNVLYPKFELTPAIAMFMATMFRAEKYRFSYGRKWHVERMRESTIWLPITKAGTPDWTFMEQYVSTLPFSSQLYPAIKSLAASTS